MTGVPIRTWESWQAFCSAVRWRAPMLHGGQSPYAELLERTVHNVMPPISLPPDYVELEKNRVAILTRNAAQIALFQWYQRAPA